MTQAGDEYDFISAIAEIIDNSIQSTKNNDKNRRITIQLIKSTKTLIIWDNGIGMDREGLNNWARMGMSSYNSAFEAPSPQKMNKNGAVDLENSTEESISKYLTSEFSRYGVGSKKAIFNLGNKVSLTTKTKTSRFVYKTSLSRKELEKDSSEGKSPKDSQKKSKIDDGSDNWKAVFDTVPATEQETTWNSFTQIEISDLKDLYVKRYDERKVRRELGNIYHYYIFGPEGNIKFLPKKQQSENLQKGQNSQKTPKTKKKSGKAKKIDEEMEVFASAMMDDDDESEDIENEKEKQNDDEDSEAEGKFKTIDIEVEGKSIKDCLSEEEKDLHTQYLSTGQEKFSFSFDISVPDPSSSSFMNEEEAEDEKPSPQPQSAFDVMSVASKKASSLKKSQNKQISSRIRGNLFYYPFVRGKETLPIPPDVFEERKLASHTRLSSSRHSAEKEELVDVELDKDIPLPERKPGFSCFWNGRLLPQEHIQNLAFMKTDRTIPDNCFRRIKGFLFLDSNFQVSANKHYLLKQVPLYQELISYSKREFVKKFKEWIKNCHAKLDDELQFGEADNERNENEKNGRIFFKSVKLSIGKISIGTFVCTKSMRPKIIGKVNGIFKLEGNEGSDCSVIIEPHNHVQKNHDEKEDSDDEEDEEGMTIVSVTKIGEILTIAQYEKEVKKLKSNLTFRLDFSDDKKLPDSYKQLHNYATISTPFRKTALPTLEDLKNFKLQTNKIVKYIAVTLFSGDLKPVSKTTAPITLNVSVLEINNLLVMETMRKSNNPTSSLSWCMTVDKPHKEYKSSYIFQLSKLFKSTDQNSGIFKSEKDFFKTAGKYKFSFTSGDADNSNSQNFGLDNIAGSPKEGSKGSPNVNSLEFLVVIEPGTFRKLEFWDPKHREIADSSSLLETRIGEQLDPMLKLVLLDESDNFATIAQTEDNRKDFAWKLMFSSPDSESNSEKISTEQEKSVEIHKSAEFSWFQPKKNSQTSQIFSNNNPNVFLKKFSIQKAKLINSDPLKANLLISFRKIFLAKPIKIAIQRGKPKFLQFAQETLNLLTENHENEEGEEEDIPMDGDSLPKFQVFLNSVNFPDLSLVALDISGNLIEKDDYSSGDTLICELFGPDFEENSYSARISKNGLITFKGLRFKKPLTENERKRLLKLRFSMRIPKRAKSGIPMEIENEKEKEDEIVVFNAKIFSKLKNEHHVLENHEEEEKMEQEKEKQRELLLKQQREAQLQQQNQSKTNENNFLKEKERQRQQELQQQQNQERDRLQKQKQQQQQIQPPQRTVVFKNKDFFIKLTPPQDLLKQINLKESRKEIEIRCPVGEKLFKSWRGEIFDEKDKKIENFSGTCTVSWGSGPNQNNYFVSPSKFGQANNNNRFGSPSPKFINKETYPVVNGTFILPEIEIPTKPGTFEHSLEITKKAGVLDDEEEETEQKNPFEEEEIDHFAEEDEVDLFSGSRRAGNEKIVYKLAESSKISLRFITFPAKPCKFKCETIMEKVTCLVPFHLIVCVTDAFDNTFHLTNDALSHETLSLISPMLQINQIVEFDMAQQQKEDQFPQKGESQTKGLTLIQKDLLFEKIDGKYQIKNIVVAGTPCKFELVMCDKTNVISSSKMRMSLEVGFPHHMRINGERELNMRIENFARLPKISLSVHDEFGNNIKNPTMQFEITQPATINPEGEPEEKFFFRDCSQEESSVCSLSMTEEGCFDLNMMVKKSAGFVNPLKPETGNVEFSVRDSPNISPAILKLTMTASRHPRKLHIKKQLEAPSLQAGSEFVPIEVTVFAENNKPVKVPEGLTCKLSGEDGSEVHEAVEHDDPTRGPYYLFPNIKRVVTKAQVYEFDINCSLDKLPHAALLRDEADTETALFLRERFQIMVVPGPATKLKSGQENFVLPPIVNSSASKAQRSFWPDRFIIQLVDEFQNKVSNFPCNSTVKVEIIAKDPKDSTKVLNLPSDSLPVFEQVTVNQRVTAGQAVFPTLSVKPKIGKSGHYLLRFSLEITEKDSQQKKVSIADIAPLELPFIFTDNTELRNEEKRIQEEKAKINEKLIDLRNLLKKSNSDHEMTSKNINTLKENWKSLKETLMKGINSENFFSNFEESVPQLLTDPTFKEDKLKIMKLLEKLNENEEILSEIQFLSQISEKIKIICDFVKETFNSKRRKPKIPPRSSNPAFEFVLGTLKSKDEFWEKAILGSLADLGHIQDDKIDFAISNALKQNLATIVVDTTKSAEMIKKEIKTFISTLEKPKNAQQNYSVQILPLDMLTLPPKGFFFTFFLKFLSFFLKFLPFFHIFVIFLLFFQILENL